MMNFLEWRNGPAQRLLREAMGFDISQISSWEEYTQTFVYVVNRGGGHAVVEKMRDTFGSMSSGEQILFAACICAGDYSWLSDELMEDRTWRRIWFNLSDNYRISVAAAIARI